jgi:hypothetical protein
MRFSLRKPVLSILIFTLLLSVTVPALAQVHTGKKIFMITDMEGVDGIFNFDDQCIPFNPDSEIRRHR